MNAFRIHYGEDPNQFGDVRLPAQAGLRPLLVSIHGGYWRAKYDLTHMEPLCEAFTEAGWVTWNVEYRRVGNPGGGWPGTIEDLEAALEAARKHLDTWSADPARIVVVGFSAGGHLALCLAARQRRLRGAVSLGGVVDIQRAWDLGLSNNAAQELLGGSPSKHPDADPVQLRIKGVRQRLIHGTVDEAVPLELSQRYFKTKKALGEDVSLLEIPNASHFDLITPGSGAWTQVVAVVEAAGSLSA